MLVVDLDLTIDEEDELDFSIDEEEVELDLSDTYEIINYRGLEHDHNKLINRDLDNQHPIKAIIGLQEILDEEDIEPMTMLDVIELWNQL